MCFGGSDTGTNRNDLAIERERSAREAAERAAAQRAEEQAKAEEQRKLRRWQGDAAAAYEQAIADAQQYFADQGVDTTEYLDEISGAARRARASIPTLSTQLQTYFDNLGQSVYEDALSSQQARARRDLNTFAGTGFDTKLITDAADDPINSAILSEQEAKAKTQLDTLRARGILSDAGYNAALAELTGQEAKAKANLDALGSTALATGRANLRDIVSNANTAIGSASLGAGPDPFSYNTELNDRVREFFAGLGDNIKGKLTGDLFDVNSAFAKGGFYQGAGNTSYDENAANGIFEALAQDNQATKKKKDDEELANFFAAF